MDAKTKQKIEKELWDSAEKTSERINNPGTTIMEAKNLSSVLWRILENIRALKNIPVKES